MAKSSVNLEETKLNLTPCSNLGQKLKSNFEENQLWFLCMRRDGRRKSGGEAFKIRIRVSFVKKSIVFFVEVQEIKTFRFFLDRKPLRKPNQNPKLQTSFGCCGGGGVMGLEEVEEGAVALRRGRGHARGDWDWDWGGTLDWWVRNWLTNRLVCKFVIVGCFLGEIERKKAEICRLLPEWKSTPEGPKKSATDGPGWTFIRGGLRIGICGFELVAWGFRMEREFAVGLGIGSVLKLVKEDISLPFLGRYGKKKEKSHINTNLGKTRGYKYKGNSGEEVGGCQDVFLHPEGRGEVTLPLGPLSFLGSPEDPGALEAHRGEGGTPGSRD